MTVSEMAEAMYNAYSKYLGNSKTPGFKTWDELSQQRQGAWIAAAKAIDDANHS